MKITHDWMKRRWFDFRYGHSVYLIFLIQFLQFVIITYELNVKGLGIFPSIFHWVGFFMVTYLPAALLVGHFHLKKQKPIEDRQNAVNNPYTFQTSPGKEQLYQLPANLTAYELQLKNMNIHNQMADFIHEVFNRPIEKWTKDDFEKVKYWKEITGRLQKGESINDIVGEGHVQRHP